MDLSEKYKNLTRSDYENISDLSWPTFDEFLQHQNVPDHVYHDIDQQLNLEHYVHPSFCILPFFGIEYPSKTFCCLTPSGSDREHVKQQMLDGIRPSECQKCWGLEDRGIRSDRMIKNDSFDFYHNKTVKELLTKHDIGIVSYKIDTSSTCNATCVTCGPQLSSAWAALEVRDDKKSNPVWRINPSSLDIDYTTVKDMSFRGGEPLLSKENFLILQKLVDAGNTDCMISFVTNGSIRPNDQQTQLLKRFKNLVISLSIDGVGPVFEYLRYPLKWQDILDNIQWWRSLGVELGISYTVSNLNIFYHDQTCQWFKDIKIPFLINPVYDPPYFRPNALPWEIKETIRHRLDDDILKNLISAHDDQEDHLFKQSLIEIQRQDTLKSISIKSYLPEFCDLAGI